MNSSITNFEDLSEALSNAASEGAAIVHIVPGAPAARLLKRSAGGGLEKFGSVAASDLPRLLQEIVERSKAGPDPEVRTLTIESGKGDGLTCQVATVPGGTIPHLCITLAVKDPPRLQLPQIGVKPDEERTLRNWMAADSGLILVAGGIASGKSSTSDAMLDLVSHDKGRLAYRIDGERRSINASDRTAVTDMEDPIAIRRMLYRLANSDIDVIGVANPDRDGVLPSEVARAAMDLCRRGKLILLDVVANDVLPAVAQIDCATGESCWGDCVGVVAQTMNREEQTVSYKLLSGPKARSA